MPDHLHVLTDSVRKPSDTLRFMNGILSHRVIAYLKDHNLARSLQKLRNARTDQSYSLVDHHSNVLLLTSENAFMQRVNYIHQNPVRAGLAARAEDYRWSSARCWRRMMLEDEPLAMDLDRIVWRKPH
jgi:putative transposase